MEFRCPVKRGKEEFEFEKKKGGRKEWDRAIDIIRDIFHQRITHGLFRRWDRLSLSRFRSFVDPSRLREESLPPDP